LVYLEQVEFEQSEICCAMLDVWYYELYSLYYFSVLYSMTINYA